LISVCYTCVRLYTVLVLAAMHASGRASKNAVVNALVLRNSVLKVASLPLHERQHTCERGLCVRKGRVANASHDV
jgi:hypothetical protein